MSVHFKVGDIVRRDIESGGVLLAQNWRSSFPMGHDPLCELEVIGVTPSGKHLTLKGKRGLWSSIHFSLVYAAPEPLPESITKSTKPTYTGGSSDYYQVTIKSTTTEGRPEYIAECNDIIEALGMNFAEGNAFKAIWRRAAQRTLGLTKAGAKSDGLYDAEKVEFFGKRLVEQSKCLTIK
ncbi:hypothetical protein HOS39_gp09 [Pectobacterium phage DU_PP_II]|uniref:Uncharacterized protein n=1 Tax=Pectobacterium phage DU_PP_II TaxID=2041489 RepID=A0A2D2W5T9_9CAUD|nr:hypothetical protein HOS39_gp09 [Pectobacterium phage DU_PP_II]ATS93676.1 hypothetical protein P2B40kb_p009 [Pectobacterium phage DU_PP_II]